MIKVMCEVTVYETDDKAAPPNAALIVNSHWNDDRMVVLETPSGHRFTVVAKHLKAAIDNATNTARF